ncbi:Trk system potassium transporter TrkA [Zongyangia hominis]|uniref:Trk system potassium uptake protein TrkA n=1 Tax=Zongyangia hominis TaxID=2763677 RepID=A0A926EA47_9FIRM|nr:Trk system potassium transporter TrkA [Zongyangia hominis]MBC8570013.1 Trk system potassium transporter TrkA [Zongyangia hominis]
MRIVIVGDGKVGVTLTDQLSREGHDIVIIDKDMRVLRESVDQYDVLAIHGNGASLSVQREAGVGESDLLIAATSADEVNLICCVLAKKLGVKRTIARVRNPEYDEQLIYLKEDLGLSMTINPEKAAAMEILNLLRFPAVIQRDTFAKGRVEIIELKIRKESPLAGRYLHELTHIVKAQVLICAVERGDEVIIPTGAFQMQAGDNIFVTGASRNLAALVQNLGIVEQKIKNVMLIGGSRIAYYLASALLAEGAAVKIIEIDPERCRQLAGLLPRASIVCSDGTQPEVLAAEGLVDADAVITLTDIDEENLILSMYAHQQGVYKVISKINRMEYNELCQKMGIASIVSPKNLVCNDIVRYVRAMENTEEDSVLALHRIVNDKVEALEFSVAEDTLHLNVPLRDIRLRDGVLLACINRNGKIIIPGGNDVLRKRDSVIVVTTADRMYGNLNAIFA